MLEWLLKTRKKTPVAPQDTRAYKTWVPLGHFYSPFPDLEDLKKNENRIWHDLPEELKGIDLRSQEQLQLLEKFAGFYEELPFGDNKKEGLRYYYQNPSYSYADAIFLFSMLRHLRPKRIIEVGSGFSSCVTLDVNELFLGKSLKCTFIEPYPDLLLSLLSGQDKEEIRLIKSNLQDVPLEVFSELESGDVLFIDSTHVSRTGSDVNYILFEILPSLKSGVYIHVHDIFYPFEYPKEWVFEGRGWNEAYALRAFLQFNERFRIVFFSNYMVRFHRDIIETKMPLCLRNTGGNIWIKKM